MVKEYENDMDIRNIIDKKSISQRTIILSDFNSLVLENINRNLELNNVKDMDCNIKTQTVDFYHTSIEDENTVNVILAADVICKTEDAIAVADTIKHLIVPGGIAIVVSADAKHRFGVDRFESECIRVGLQIETTNVADFYDGQLLHNHDNNDDGIHQTSGYVDDMSLTLFRIHKSNTIQI
uniref:Calmodulin-lysine N-methyltransferase n=1 Tax=Eucampia antarctica TaxID=49252 RepID=A0A7S2SCM3_9STRA|mmetsp:Transcript_6085/g.5685  ORF Transcript_6085/g.5685 Transcript_6085/m.5685 type:complete len:181 (+) Transcript_6085:289-831(+)